MNARLRQCGGVLMVALAAAGCANKQVALDGDHEPELAAGGASSEGGIVRTLDDEGPFLVDDERLYWVGGAALHGCSKASCASSRVDYYSWPDFDALSPSDYEISWLASEGGDFIWATRDAIMSCPRAGCVGEPSRLGPCNRLYPRAVDETWFASSNADGIYVMPRAGGDWQRLVERKANYAPLAIHAGYIYWIEAGVADEGKAGELLRVREQGSTEVETLAGGLVGALGGQIAFDSSFVYFTDARQSGAVLRCPLDGCSGVPEEVVGPVRSPGRLAVDDHGICVSYSLRESEMAVGCAAPAEPLQQRYAHARDLVMDADYVYALHASSAFDVADLQRTWDISRLER